MPEKEEERRSEWCALLFFVVPMRSSLSLEQGNKAKTQKKSQEQQIRSCAGAEDYSIGPFEVASAHDRLHKPMAFFFSSAVCIA